MSAASRDERHWLEYTPDDLGKAAARGRLIEPLLEVHELASVRELLLAASSIREQVVPRHGKFTVPDGSPQSRELARRASPRYRGGR
jgi:hypothetical protein